MEEKKTATPATAKLPYEKAEMEVIHINGEMMASSVCPNNTNNNCDESETCQFDQI